MTGVAPETLPLVVGVSLSSGSPVAVRWTCDEAARRGTTVVAVRAWRTTRPPSSTTGPMALYEHDLDAEREREHARLEADVRAAFDGGDPPVELRYELVQGTPLTALQEWSKNAALVVLDAPRRTDLDAPPLLAHRIVYTAACPVVIMPPLVSGSPDSAVVSAGKWLAAEALRAAGTAGRPGVRPPQRG